MSGLTLLAALKAFDATVRAGSMSAAARSLGLRQPTVVLADHGVSLCLPVELPIGEEGGYFAGLTALGGGVEGGGARALGIALIPCFSGAAVPAEEDAS